MIQSGQTNGQCDRKRVAILIEQGVEDVEFQIPYNALRKAGAVVVVLGSRTNEDYVGKQGKVSVRADGTTTEARAGDFDAVIIPGGYAPDKMRTNLKTVRFVQAEKWASMIGGGAMVLMGLQQRSLRGVLMAIAGGSMAYHGATSDRSITERVSEATGLDKAIKVEKTVTINRSAEELYSFWRNFGNLPTFMKHLKSVTVLDERRSHWVATAPLDQSVEWDAEIILNNLVEQS